MKKPPKMRVIPVETAIDDSDSESSGRRTGSGGIGRKWAGLAMRELNIMFRIVETVQGVIDEHGLSEIGAVVLDVGALSTVTHSYLNNYFPIAANGTELEGAELRIRELPANAQCLSCSREYDVKESRGICPDCGRSDYDLLSGTGFYVKEILAC
jgi:hydrogenase nickel incorporation protein HypA/HybF